MKIYRVSIRLEDHASDGYFYTPNKAVADAKCKAENKRTGCEDWVEEIEFKPTKKSVLSMLNIYCSYPDNG